MAESHRARRAEGQLRVTGLTRVLVASRRSILMLRCVGLREVVYNDQQGRRWLRGIPEGLPDGQAVRGVPLGPPPLTDLGLPLEIEVALHNQLFDRHILTEKEARRRPNEVFAALQAALRVDLHKVLGIYAGNGAHTDGTT